MRMQLIEEAENIISINFSAQWDNPIEIEGILGFVSVLCKPLRSTFEDILVNLDENVGN